MGIRVCVLVYGQATEAKCDPFFGFVIRVPPIRITVHHLFSNNSRLVIVLSIATPGQSAAHYVLRTSTCAGAVRECGQFAL